MDPKKKTGCKIMLILFGLFFIIGALFLFFTIKFTISELKDISKHKDLKEAEKIRFENLPVLKGVILEEDSVKTPFSKKNVNVCFMNFGLTNSHKVNMHWKNSTARNYVTTYSIFSTFYKRNHINLLINGKRYILNSSDIVLVNIFSDSQTTDKIGIWGDKFSTDMDYDKLLFLNDYKFYKQYFKTTVKQEREYLEKVKTFCMFKNTNDYINCYYLTRFHKKNIPENCYHATSDSYHLREYIYNTGDTLSFKGKIVNNKIVLLH